MAKTQYRVTQELHYGTATILTETDAFVDLYQSNYSYPNRVEGLREINIKNIGKVPIELDFTINAWTSGTPDEDGATVFISGINANSPKEDIALVKKFNSETPKLEKIRKSLISRILLSIISLIEP